MNKISKIIKNRSGETRTILNRDIANDDEYDVPYHLWMELVADDGIEAYVTNGDYVINNGVTDLSVTDALSLINQFQETSSNFSYHYIEENLQVTIPEGQHMYTWELDLEGSIDICGKLILIEE